MGRFRCSRSAVRTPRTAGVTLVEVVIAIFVLTVGVLGIISLFPSGYRLGQRAFDHSVGALAARDALPRILTASKGTFTFPKQPGGSSTTVEPLYHYYYNSTTKLRYGVPAQNRVGTIAHPLSAHSLTCRIRGNVVPSTSTSSADYWPNLGGHYFVLTSGSAAGRVFLISSSSGGSVSFASSGDHAVTFRSGNATQGIPVRVGDHFAIIGTKSGTKCHPPAFLSKGASNRTIEVATHGTAPRGGAIPWEYGYGCIVSASTPEMRDLYRVDVFVFRGFNPNVSLEQQQRPAGHFVTYLARLDDYDNPF